MPSGSFNQVYARCPFYKWDDGKKRIVCEGIVDESSIALIYHRRADFECQFTVFCCEHYEKCEISRILMDKYEDYPMAAPSKRHRETEPKKFEQQLSLFDMMLPE